MGILIPCFWVPQLSWPGWSYKDYHRYFLSEDIAQNLWNHAKWGKSIKTFVKPISLEGICCLAQWIWPLRKVSLDKIVSKQIDLSLGFTSADKFFEITEELASIPSSLVVWIVSWLLICCHVQFAWKLLCSKSDPTLGKVISYFFS